MAHSRGAAAYVLSMPRTSHRAPPCILAFVSNLPEFTRQPGRRELKDSTRLEETAMTDGDRFRVADLTTEEFATAMRAGRWLLLPSGTLEEHGPHLPLTTDTDIVTAVARGVGLSRNGMHSGLAEDAMNRSSRLFVNDARRLLLPCLFAAAIALILTWGH